MSDPITARELDVIREHQAVFMPDLISIRRPVFLGDNEREWETVYSSVSARITPGFGFWRDVADRFQGITAYTVTVPWDQDVQAGWVLIDASSRAYEVRDVRAPSSFHTAKQMLVDRVSDDG